MVKEYLNNNGSNIDEEGGNGSHQHTPNFSRSPSGRTLSKWKIPHYYKRSSSNNSSAQSSNNNQNESINLNSNTPSKTLNVVSPKKLLFENSNGSRAGFTKKASKKKNGQMTFVNYTVQDSPSTDDVIRIDLSNAVSNASNQLSPGISVNEVSPKRQTTRNKVLKFFGSSKSPIAKPNNGNMMNTGLSSNSPVISNIGNVKKVPSHSRQSSRQIYNSLLKTELTAGRSLPVSKSQQELVGELINSNYNSNYGTASNATEYLNKSNSTPNLINTRLPNQNVKTMNYNKQFNNSFDKNQQSSKFGSPIKFDSNSNNDEMSFNAQYFQNSNDNFSNELNVGDIDLNQLKQVEENDASIAFNKMFTRHRTNTASSQSSITSNLTVTNSPYHVNNGVPGFYNMGRNSVSPNRRRSRAHTNSSLNRLSKDFTSIPNTYMAGDSSNNINRATSLKKFNSQNEIEQLGQDAYLDSYKSHSTSKSHKKQQLSISELYRISTMPSLQHNPDPRTYRNVRSTDYNSLTFLGTNEEDEDDGNSLQFNTDEHGYNDENTALKNQSLDQFLLNLMESGNQPMHRKTQTNDITKIKTSPRENDLFSAPLLPNNSNNNSTNQIHGAHLQSEDHFTLMNNELQETMHFLQNDNHPQLLTNLNKQYKISSKSKSSSTSSTTSSN